MVKIILDGKASMEIVSKANLTALQIATNKQQLTPILELFRIRMKDVVAEEKRTLVQAAEESERQQRETMFSNQLMKLEFMKSKNQRILDMELYVLFLLVISFLSSREKGLEEKNKMNSLVPKGLFHLLICFLCLVLIFS
jgi:hypothetical protein